MLGDLHHIELYVSNLEVSREFYGWFLKRLGWEEYQSWHDGQSWRRGRMYLVIVQTEETYLSPPYHRKRIGLNHLAFYANSRKTVDKIAAELKERGTRILYTGRFPYAGGADHYAVFFEDPDRIKLELVAP
ncbi:MAG: VOC family protein [Lentisphaeria bacterium]|nr:VOC family protein [Candidatus Neomarinimicrobiota bacterium]MCF7841765.1 VOC family protein [Lentisphaeria bacterium]